MHTPGPWTITKIGPALRYVVWGPNGERIVTDYGDNGAQDADNVRLIAEAPAMLEALRDLVAFAEAVETPVDDEPAFRFESMLANARAAIAKAEGRTP